MSAKSRFELIYAPQVKTHLQVIERKYYSLIHRTIETQLQSEPNVETRNRKPLERPGRVKESNLLLTLTSSLRINPLCPDR